MNDTSRPQPSAEILAAQQEIIDTFNLFDDWTDRYQYIIDLGKETGDFPDALRTEGNRLHGCQSQVWLIAERKDERLYYRGTSDSSIVAGLVAVLLAVYSGRTPEDIVATPPDFVAALKLAEHLSPTRSNGLHAMIQRIKQIAVETLANS